MKRSTSYITIGILCLIIGYLSAHFFKEKKEIFQEQQSILMLEQAKKVFRIIAVEGHISEIFDHKEYWGYDVSPFRKTMLIRAIGKVSIGFNTDSLNIDLDSESKTIKIGPFLAPEILSLDHDIDYYDVSEGFFNEFSPNDYSKIQKKVKLLILEKSKEGQLFTKAIEQKNELLLTFQLVVEPYGWKVVELKHQEENYILD